MRLTDGAPPTAQPCLDVLAISPASGERRREPPIKRRRPGAHAGPVQIYGTSKPLGRRILDRSGLRCVAQPPMLVRSNPLGDSTIERIFVVWTHEWREPEAFRQLVDQAELVVVLDPFYPIRGPVFERHKVIAIGECPCIEVRASFDRLQIVAIVWTWPSKTLDRRVWSSQHSITSQSLYKY